MAARLVLDVNRSPEPFVCWVSALGVKEVGGPLVLVVPYTFDHPNRRLIFVKVSSLEDLAAEPFLDRGIRKVATDRGYALPFDVGLEYALDCHTPAAGPPGRCGSTLLHRALSAVGACSLSEPHWLHQFYSPWDPEPGWTLVRCVGHLLHVLCAGLLHVKDSKVFILNLKGIAARCGPCVSGIQMYRNAVDVLESFGSSRPGDTPPPRTEDLRASHVPVLQERLSPADTSLIPQDNICKDMSLHWAETF